MQPVLHRSTLHGMWLNDVEKAFQNQNITDCMANYSRITDDGGGERGSYDFQTATNIK